MKLETFVNSHIDPPYFLPRTFIPHALYDPCGGVPLYESRPSRNNANNAKLPRHDVAFFWMGKVRHCSTSGGRILSTTPCSFPDDDRSLLPDNPVVFWK